MNCPPPTNLYDCIEFVVGAAAAAFAWWAFWKYS